MLTDSCRILHAEELIAFCEDKYVGENGNAAFVTSNDNTRVFLSLHVIYWRTLKADTNIQHRLRARSPCLVARWLAIERQGKTEASLKLREMTKLQHTLKPSNNVLRGPQDAPTGRMTSFG